MPKQTEAQQTIDEIRKLLWLSAFMTCEDLIERMNKAKEKLDKLDEQVELLGNVCPNTCNTCRHGGSCKEAS